MELENKKGLKNLARLLIAILKKNRLNPSKNLNAEIEKIMIKDRKKIKRTVILFLFSNTQSIQKISEDGLMMQ